MMATPFPFAVGQVLTAGQLNSIGDYTDISSTQTFFGFTRGNATVVSRYTEINNFVHFYGAVTLGSTSSMTAALDIALPFTAHLGVFNYNSACSFWSGSILYWGTALNITANNLRLVAHNSAGTYARNADTSATVPFTWGTNSVFVWNHFYEKA